MENNFERNVAKNFGRNFVKTSLHCEENCFKIVAVFRF